MHIVGKNKIHHYFCRMFPILFPLIAAVLGYLVNSILIGYITRKALPARMPAVATQAGQYAASLVNTDELAARIADPEKLKSLHPYIEQHVDVFLKEKLKEKMPAIAMFVGEKTMDMMKKGLMEEIELLLPNLLQQYMGSLKERLDIGAMVTKGLNGMTPGQVDSLLRKGLARERAMFKWAGAASGLLIGLLLLALQQLIP